MMLSENGSPVSLRIADSVVEIALNRPPANALGMPIIDGLHIGLDAADALPAKVIVVSSALHRLLRRRRRHQAHVVRGRGIVRRIWGRPARRRRAPGRPPSGVGGRHRRARVGRRTGAGHGVLVARRRFIGAARSARGQARPDPGRRWHPAPTPPGRPRTGTGPHAHRQRGRTPTRRFWIGLVDRLVPNADTAAQAARGNWPANCALPRSPAQRAVVRTVAAAYDRPLAEGLRYEAEQVQRAVRAGRGSRGYPCVH